MHRTVLLLLASLCLLAPRAAHAQDDLLGKVQDWFSKLGKPPPPPPPEELGAQDTFTMNPLALDHQQLGVEYERAFGKGFSLFLAPEFSYGASSSQWQLTAGGTLGTRIFVFGSAPSGIFFGPEVTALYQRVYRDGALKRGLGLGFGGSVGFTLVLFNRLAVSAGFAAEYRTVPQLDSPDPDAFRVELVPVPRLAFGVAF